MPSRRILTIDPFQKCLNVAASKADTDTTGQDDRNYFIIKHDLESLLDLPHYIWRTHLDPSTPPVRFDQVGVGDRWVSFAFKNNDREERRVSKITGFSECIRTMWYGTIPKQGLAGS